MLKNSTTPTISQKQTSINFIREKFPLITDRTGFIIRLAQQFDKRPLYLKNAWFGPYIAIPEIHLPEVCKLIQAELDCQI